MVRWSQLSNALESWGFQTFFIYNDYIWYSHLQKGNDTIKIPKEETSEKGFTEKKIQKPFLLRIPTQI